MQFVAHISRINIVPILVPNKRRHRFHVKHKEKDLKTQSLSTTVELTQIFQNINLVEIHCELESSEQCLLIAKNVILSVAGNQLIGAKACLYLVLITREF